MAAVPAFDVSGLVLLQVAVLLAAARALGTLAARLGLTRVVGELATGFVLGPSVLGAVAPGAAAALFPGGGSSLLSGLSLVGLVLLLALAGMELDVGLLRAHARDVAAIGSAGLAVPFVLGVGLGLSLPASLAAGPTPRPVVALFLAVALSISAIPVIVRILVDLEAIDRPFGQLTVAAAMYTDAVGWLLLSAVVGIARTGALDLRSVAVVVLALAGFLVAARLVGAPLVAAALARLGDRPVGGGLALVVVAAFGASATTIAIGLEPALGAFVAGLLVARAGGLDERAADTYERATLGVFAPLFFGVAGLRADLGLLLDPTVAAVGALTLVVATAGKLVGVGAAAAWLGHGRQEAFAMGAGLNARGAVEIVIAAVGLQLGVLGVELYTVVLGVAVLTSAMAPPMLRYAIRRMDRDGGPAGAAAEA